MRVQQITLLISILSLVACDPAPRFRLMNATSGPLQLIYAEGRLEVLEPKRHTVPYIPFVVRADCD